MALFPAENVGMALADIDAIRAWVAVPAPAWGGFVRQIGDPGAPIRNLAMLPHSVVHAAVATTQITAGTPPVARDISPVEAAQVGLVWRIARRIAFTASGNSWATFVDVDPCEALVVNTGVQQTGPSVTTPSSFLGTKVKISTILDQGDDGEVAQATATQIETWFQVYVTMKRAHPAEEEEPTAAQLTALHHRVNVVKSTPYADFALWGPFGRKAQRAGKFRAWLMAPGGGYFSKELPGPECMTHWLASWRVFAVACIMLELISEAALQSYERMIEKLTRLWPSAWHLVVIADDKCRAEHLERLRRRTAANVAAGHPRPPDWDPEQPWTAVLRLAAEDTVFWDEQVRQPAAAWVASGSRGLASSPEEDMARARLPGGLAAIRGPVEGDGAGRKRVADPADTWKGTKSERNARQKRRKAETRAAAERWSFPPLPPVPKGVKGKKGGGRGDGGKGHGKDQLHNQVCYDWSGGTGECGSLPPHSTCPKGRAHKCRVCLSPAHQASGCPSA
jgi:hypothetical protein